MTVGSLSAAFNFDRLLTRTTWLAGLRILGITAQFGLAVLVIRSFDLEGPTFTKMIYLAGIGFVVHAVLPKAFRQPWFILLSLVGIGVILGARNGLWLVALGLGLIGICHLPIRWWFRVTLLLLVAAGLAALRLGAVDLPISVTVWPVLGSMFMFRLALYIHHIRHAKVKPSLGRALSYFFMLPNVAFPLFPVVDFKTFDATWYDQDSHTIHQTGMRLIARGLFHLVLYRYVYFYVARDPAELANLADLLTYVVSVFLLYLRVSGQFHIIVGILHLFGYRLPQTNNLYYLAGGFTDVWRRNNIYWKDFMMKLVYYPSFFRLRRRGQKFGLIGATILVFVLTWLLHSYQWFWIRGDFPITATDIAFWGAVGFFMLIEMLRDANRPAAIRAGAERSWSLARALKVVGFFFFFSCLWALWDSESIGDFLSLWSLADQFDGHTLKVVAVILVVALAIAGWPWGSRQLDDAAPSRSLWRRDDVQTVFVCLGLLALAQPTITNVAGLPFTRVAQQMRNTGLNDRDAASQHRGYYEQLNVAGGVATGRVQEVNADRPRDWVQLTETPVYRQRDDFMASELVPSYRLDFKGQTLSTNRWGMRDQEYPADKPQGAFRFAVLGPSDVMGAGVLDNQTFEAVLEERLNRERKATDSTNYEILNFAVVSHSILQQEQVFHQRSIRFSPDVVIVSYHPISEARFAFQHLANMAALGVKLPHQVLRDIVDEAGVRPGMKRAESFRRLKPYGERLVEFALHRVRDLAHERGMKTVFLIRDLPAERSKPDERMAQVAAGLGFEVIDIRDVFEGRNPETLRLASWDKHPNAEGHRLIADRLFAELGERGLLKGAP